MQVTERWGTWDMWWVVVVLGEIERLGADQLRSCKFRGSERSDGWVCCGLDAGMVLSRKMRLCVVGDEGCCLAEVQ